MCSNVRPRRGQTTTALRRWLAYACAFVALSVATTANATVVTKCSSEDTQEKFQSQAKALLTDFAVGGFVHLQSQDSVVSLELDSRFHKFATFEFPGVGEFNLALESVALPKGGQGELVSVQTSSRREILLAMVHPARDFQLPSCDLSALVEHIGVRQNIAAWTESLSWGWPDGGPAYWNTHYWNKGTPINLNETSQSLRDAFQNPQAYALGCYTAAKMVYAQAVLDFYERVLQDQEKTQLVLNRLLRDADPLVHIEPPKMWEFYPEYDAKEEGISGKLLRIEYGVASQSIVPGDWLYAVNDDPKSAQKTGYEGSNAIYVGMDRFASYYEPEGPRYTTLEKINDVYQWRHGVFNRPADAYKEEAVSSEFLAELMNPPSEGGLLVPIRVVPYFFGFEPLPE